MNEWMMMAFGRSVGGDCWLMPFGWRFVNYDFYDDDGPYSHQFYRPDHTHALACENIHEKAFNLVCTASIKTEHSSHAMHIKWVMLVLYAHTCRRWYKQTGRHGHMRLQPNGMELELKFCGNVRSNPQKKESKRNKLIKLTINVFILSQQTIKRIVT